MRQKLIVLLATVAMCGGALAQGFKFSNEDNAEKAREAAIAIQHEQEVTAKATAVDQAVSQDANPQDTLQKEWSK